MAGAEKGYTLIEILIALTLFSVGMLAVASMQISGIQGNATSKWTSEASSWTADRIEQFLPLDYDDTDLSNGSHGPVTQGIYEITWDVTENAPINNVKTIDVTVDWEDRGMDKTTTFTTYKADL